MTALGKLGRRVSDDTESVLPSRGAHLRCPGKPDLLAWARIESEEPAPCRPNGQCRIR